MVAPCHSLSDLLIGVRGRDTGLSAKDSRDVSLPISPPYEWWIWTSIMLPVMHFHSHCLSVSDTEDKEGGYKVKLPTIVWVCHSKVSHTPNVMSKRVYHTLLCTSSTFWMEYITDYYVQILKDSKTDNGTHCIYRSICNSLSPCTIDPWAIFLLMQKFENTLVLEVLENRYGRPTDCPPVEVLPSNSVWYEMGQNVYTVCMITSWQWHQCNLAVVVHVKASEQVPGSLLPHWNSMRFFATESLYDSNSVKEVKFVTLYRRSSNTSRILWLVRYYVLISSRTCRHCEISKKPTFTAKNTPLFLFPYMGHSLQIFAWGMPLHAHVFSFTHNAVVLSLFRCVHPENQITVFWF